MPYGDKLFQRLSTAKRDELDEVLLALRLDPKKYERAADRDVVVEISRRLRSAAGHSVRNVFRDVHDLPYKKILIDVADKLAPGRGWTSFNIDGPESEEQIEDYIEDRVRARYRDHIERLPPNERAKVQAALEEDLRKRGVPQNIISSVSAGLATGVLGGGILGPAVASALFAGFWTWLVGLSLTELLLGGLLAGGPVGGALAGLTLLTATSYSKTIPTVVRLVYIRRSREAEEELGSS